MKNVDVPLWDKGDNTDNFVKGGASQRSMSFDGVVEADKNITSAFKLVLGRKPSTRESAYYRISRAQKNDIILKLISGAEHKDMAAIWYEKHRLPFVFALLCYHKDKRVYKQIEKKFSKQKIKIPQYILQEASLRTKISKNDIAHYLEYISYTLDKKAQLGLKKFYKQVANLTLCSTITNA